MRQTYGLLSVWEKQFTSRSECRKVVVFLIMYVSNHLSKPIFSTRWSNVLVTDVQWKWCGYFTIIRTTIEVSKFVWCKTYFYGLRSSRLGFFVQSIMKVWQLDLSQYLFRIIGAWWLRGDWSGQSVTRLLGHLDLETSPFQILKGDHNILRFQP